MIQRLVTFLLIPIVSAQFLSVVWCHEAPRYEVSMKTDGDDAEQDTPLEGRYANHFQVGHNAFEFLLDFGQLYPESKRAQFHTRIVLGPPYAKALLEVLQESISRYERTFAAIPGEGSNRDRSGNG